MRTNQMFIGKSAGFIALAGVLLFSAKAVIIKLVYQYNIDPVSLMMLRMIFAVPFILTIWFVYEKKKTRMKFNQKDILQVVVLSIIGYYIPGIFDFFGLQYVTAGIERLILFIYPTMVLALSSVFLKKPVTKKQAIAVVLTYLGLFVVFSNKLDITLNRDLWIGAGLIFVSAFTYAIFLTGSGELIPKLGTVRFTSIAMIVTTICITSHYLAIDAEPLQSYPSEVYFYCLILAVFSTVLPAYLISQAVKEIGASRVAIIGSVGPVSTVILSVLFLSEVITARMLVGMIIVIIGVLSINVKLSLRFMKRKQPVLK